MRRSPHCSWLTNESGDIYAVYLAADYCGEHEQGIDELAHVLGIPKMRHPMGLKDRTISDLDYIAKGGFIRKADGKVQVGQIKREESYRKRGRIPIKTVPASCLSVTRYRDENLEQTLKEHGGKIFVDDLEEGKFSRRLQASWGRQGFQIVAIGEDAVKALAAITDGFAKGDIAIFMGGGSSIPFARGGMVITRPSLTPKEAVETLEMADAERKKLDHAADATGIVARVDIADGKDGLPFYMRHSRPYGYFALTPDWLNENIVGKSEHSVMFFINPMDRQNVKFGWYRVEDLDAWLKGAKLQNEVGEANDARRKTRDAKEKLVKVELTLTPEGEADEPSLSTPRI